MLYDRLFRPPFGAAWDRYLPAPRNAWKDHQGPYTASRINADDWEFLEHIRMHGRLPGAGALGAWNVNDWREPVIEPVDIVYSHSARAEKAFKDANRTAAFRLQAAQIAAIQARNEEQARLKRQADVTKRLKRAEDEKAQAAELERERQAWKAEQRHWARSAEDREERWRAEQEVWDHAGQAARRQHVKDLRRTRLAQEEERQYRRETAKKRKQWENKETAKGMRKLWVARYALIHLRQKMLEHYVEKGLWDNAQIKSLLDRGEHATKQMILARDFHGWSAIKNFTSSSLSGS